MLGEIFCHVVTLVQNTDESSRWNRCDLARSSTIVSLCLGSVCRRWRVTACSTPSLWNEIVLVPEFASPVKNQMKLAHLVLDRCQSVSLAIQVDNNYKAWGLTEFLARLQDSDITLHRLSITIPTWSVRVPIGLFNSLLASRAAQRLSDLSYSHPLDSVAHTQLPSTLRRLYTFSESCWTPMKLPVNLTVLQVSQSIPSNLAYDIIASCPFLRELRAYVCASTVQKNPSSLSDSRRLVSGLEYLSIHDEDLGPSFLLSFKFPSLRTFEIGSGPFGMELPSWLVSHPCLLQRLQRLRLIVTPAQHELFDVLSQTSELTEFSLCLSNRGEYAAFVPILTEKLLTRSPAFSNLERLHLGLFWAGLEALHLWTPSMLRALTSLVQAWSPDPPLVPLLHRGDDGDHLHPKYLNFLRLHTELDNITNPPIDFLTSLKNASGVDVKIVCYEKLSVFAPSLIGLMFELPSMAFSERHERFVMLEDGTRQAVYHEV